jgi:hypothetical protein
MKVEPTESDHPEQEMQEEVVDSIVQSAAEEEVSDEEVNAKSTFKAVPPTSVSLFNMTKGSSQVLTTCDIYEETNVR